MEKTMQKKQAMKKLGAMLPAMSVALAVGLTLPQPAHAAANMLNAVKVGGGWVSVVSYINTMPPAAGGAVYVHATHQVKNPANLTDSCTHLDGRATTTRNDLTTTVLTTPGGAAGSVYPATDIVGGAIINPPATAVATAEGFLILENYDSAGALGADGTLTSEAIAFNLTSGFLYSGRALDVTHIAASPGGNVSIEGPACGNCNYMQATPTSAGAATAFNNTTAGTLTRFMFLPPATATTGVYAIAVNRPGTAEAADLASTTNLVTSGYNARIRLEARMDALHAYNLGIYNRLEDFRSLTQGNELVCLAQLSPAQLTGGTVPTFITDGGWMNLAPRCREDTTGLGTYATCDSNAAGIEVGDAAILYKVEYATGYGYAVTPQHQQWYTK